MLDIDRNINALMYNKITHNNEEIRFIKDSLSIDINLDNATVVKTQNVNIENDTTHQDVFFQTLNKGIYYYRHTFNKVDSDNAQCLFMASTKKTSPFFSYYGQSPVLDTTLASLIGRTFFIDKDNTDFYVRIKPDTSTFKISGYITIWKLPEG